MNIRLGRIYPVMGWRVHQHTHNYTLLYRLALQTYTQLIVLTELKSSYLESSFCLQTPELTSNMVPPFLSLAVELQCDIIGRLLGSEDLKAVCLVSKHVAAIAAPFLYHDIVLDGDTAPIGRLTTIIKSLSESRNLGFARTLTIRNVVQDSVDAMDLLLPQLGEDCLKRFTARQA